MEISIDLGTIPAFNAQCARLDNEDLKNLNVRKYPVLNAFIDKMGQLSADAQKLQRVLTSYNKIIQDPEQVLYVLWEPGHKPSQSFVIGFLKIGRRNLYLYDDKMMCHQENPICLLDFYVHYGVQRKGYGKILYDVMLKRENTMPHMIAIDKPSDSLLFFLKKHYGLTNPCWQSTNYVVYPKFFEPKTMENGKNGVNNSFSSPVKPIAADDSNVFGAVSLEIGQQVLAHAVGAGDFVDFKPLSPTNQNQAPFSPTYNNQSPPPPRSSPSIGTPTPLSTNGSLPASTNSGASQQQQQPVLACCQVNPAAASVASNSLAKERKLMSMGHQKLW